MMRKVLASSVAVALAAACVPAGVSARTTSERIYHPVFQQVPGTELLSGSDYTAIYGGPLVPGLVRLISRATEHTVMISEPGCVPDAVGGVWLAMTCGSAGEMSYALNDIAQNRTVPLTLSPGLTSVTCAIGCQSIAGIGTHWIAITAPCAESMKCPTDFEFQNLSTGAILHDPTNRTTRIDLDSSRLAQPVCRLLTVPRDNQRVEDGLYPGWGSLTLDGNYGIEAGNGGVFLQRCGSRARTFLTRTPASGACPARACAPSSNRQMVLWQAAAGRLGGIFLKGLQRFQISVPATVDRLARQFPAALQDPYTLALAGNTLFFEDDTLGTVWTAQMPSAPR
jgi:hypothetical protein